MTNTQRGIVIGSFIGILLIIFVSSTSIMFNRVEEPLVEETIVKEVVKSEPEFINLDEGIAKNVITLLKSFDEYDIEVHEISIETYSDTSYRFVVFSEYKNVIMSFKSEEAESLQEFVIRIDEMIENLERVTQYE